MPLLTQLKPTSSAPFPVTVYIVFTVVVSVGVMVTGALMHWAAPGPHIAAIDGVSGAQIKTIAYNQRGNITTPNSSYCTRPALARHPRFVHLLAFRRYQILMPNVVDPSRQKPKAVLRRRHLCQVGELA